MTERNRNGGRNGQSKRLNGPEREISSARRGFLKSAGAAMASAGLGMPLIAESGDAVAAAVGASKPVPDAPPAGFNILFILTDQEHHFDRWPYPVPGRERLKREGTTFTNHQIASCVCSPSRSTVYTGQHTQHTRVFDNAGLSWQPDMSTGIRTIGHMMRDVDYYPVYLGKWHLSGTLHETSSAYNAPVQRYSTAMKEYGFDDYFGVGDLIGGVRGGYDYDGVTTASAVSWLRQHGVRLRDERKPWFMAVNIVNPHDVMFVDTDPEGIEQQRANRPLLGAARPPKDRLYDARWDDVPLPASRHQPYDERGRPAAQGVFFRARENLVGVYPLTDERVRTYRNYYFNCIRDADTHIVRLLDELESLHLDQTTIVVLTSDHGDHAGAHQLVCKGATTYKEQNHVPLIIRHPAYPGGRTCAALTSHVDLVPTLLELTGLDHAAAARVAGPAAKGRGFARLLRNPDRAAINDIRPAALYNYAMLLYYDSDWMLQELRTLMEKGVPVEELHRLVLARQPDFRLRGGIRSVFDGRYRFSRYFSLMHFNRPTTIDALFANNDVELYDLHADPGETRNLAVKRKENADLLTRMNALLNDRIDEEVGEDRPDVMPIKDGRVQFTFRSDAHI